MNFRLAFFVSLCTFLLWQQRLSAQEAEAVVLKFSPEAGFHRGSVQVEITCNYPKAAIYYTVNGGRPSSGSQRYTKPIFIDSTSTLQAVAYVDSKTSEVFASSYVFGMDDTRFPVACISLDMGHLLDPVTGLFMLGPRAARRFPYVGANWNSTRELGVHMELFESDKTRVVDGNFGFRVFGGYSRMMDQKSFSISARKKVYGTSSIKHQIFPDKDIKKFKHVVFRNSGGDFGDTHFRDAMITSLGREMGLEVQAYRPCHTFLGGRYWGIYNLREKLTPHYIQENFGYHRDSIDLMEHQRGVKAGSRAHYVQMQTYMRTYDLAEQRHFDSVARMMDVENFMEYYIIQIFINNQDAGGNIKYWRPHTEGGKWRWILFDTDFGFGHNGGSQAYKFNSLEFHLEPNGPGWPNPPWSTFNLRMMMKNKGFQDAFILRFADRLNSTFRSDYVLARIDSMANNLVQDIPKHQARWGLTMEKWHKSVERMRHFARERPMYIRQFLRQRFPHIGSDVQLHLQVDTGGYVMVNSVIYAEYDWKGTYFKNLPVTVQAYPRPGYRFSHWEDGTLQIKDRQVSVKFLDTLHRLHAVFVKGENPLARAFVINEISARDTTAGDWIEFYNATGNPLQLKGWRLCDRQGRCLIFDEQARIGAYDYLIVCRDRQRFVSVFSDSGKTVIGGLPFGLKGGKETILVYDDLGDLIDSVSYKIPKEYKDKVVTLALRDYEKDNADADQWKVVENAGSPASANPLYLQENKGRQIESLVRYLKIAGISLAGLFTVVGIYTALKRKKRQKR